MSEADHQFHKLVSKLSDLDEAVNRLVAERDAAIARAEAAEADLQRRLDAEWNAGIEAAASKAGQAWGWDLSGEDMMEDIRTLRRPTND